MLLPSLNSDRLLLRPLHDEDAPTIQIACSNQNVTRYLGRVPYPYHQKDAEAFIARCKKGLEGIHYAITHKDRLIGIIGMAPSTERLQQDFVPSIGYWLDQSFWGKGYMSEAVARFLDWYMPLEPTERVRSAVFEDNPRSLSILSRIGFTEISRGRAFSPARSQDVAQIELELTASRYYEGAK
ncbi:MAG: GNAT family N-acetyltransferase [Cohaesibacter sp.]|nr:GNAT family N-acetyltransferase [Cohaesibacter sp.]MCV6601602.1 GNAT family N-acetyltransferase [Cohaesibacter sp.]